jgi:hypothetical protein
MRPKARSNAAKVNQAGAHFSAAPKPERIRRLMWQLKAEIEGVIGATISYALLGQYSGLATGTVFNSFHRYDQKQVEGFIRLLEQLPAEARHRLIDTVCRCRPAPDHPKLAHDPVQVSQLKGLAQKHSGLTIIQGANAGLRTFVITALGHATNLPVVGIDAHEPDWFVPVLGVEYLNYASNERIHEIWKALKPAPFSVVALNGVWGRIPGGAAEARKWSAHSHVIVADDLRQRSENFAEFSPPRHLVQLSLDQADRLQLAIQVV